MLITAGNVLCLAFTGDDGYAFQIRSRTWIKMQHENVFPCYSDLMLVFVSFNSFPFFVFSLKLLYALFFLLK